MTIEEIIRQIRKYVTKEKLHNIWEKIWGKDAPPAEDLFPDDLYAYYNPIYVKLVNKIKLRRFFVSIIILILGLYFLINIFDIIKNTPFLACLGKEVCITKGPKLVAPDSLAITIRLNNGDIFVINPTGNKGYKYLYHKLTYIPRNILNIIPYSSYHIKRFDKKYSNFLNRDPYYLVFQMYIHKNNKFIKIKNLLDIRGYRGSIYKDAYDNIYIISYNGTKVFNLKSRQFSKGPKYTNKQHKHTFIAQYDENQVFGYEYKNIISNINTITSIPVRANLYNLSNGTKKELPKFAIPPKFFPMAEDYKFLSNGKIIIPIRDCNSKVRGINLYCDYIWDHIEIYDPYLNKFIAETNTDVLDKNLFDIDLPDGNVLFINKESSYIFNNKTNTFEKPDIQDQVKYANDVATIQDMSARLLGIELNNHITNTSKIIKIAPDQFLITCGNQCYYKYSKKPTKVCNQTIYYNFTKGKITKGPNFLYPHYFSSIEKITNSNFMVIGGTSEFESFDTYFNKLPNEYTQFIWVKSNRRKG